MEGSTNILIVDDEPFILDIISQIVEGNGYTAFTATDGEEALDILKAESIDLILADIGMPGMNGYQLYNEIIDEPNWMAIPFIFLTARDFDSDIRYGKELGVDDYLLKPVKAQDIIATIRGSLRRARKRTQIPPPPTPTAAQTPEQMPILEIGILKVSPGQHRAWMDNVALPLSAKEFMVLEYLALRVNTVVSPQDLVKITHNFKTDHTDASNLIRPIIRSIRRKLGYPVGKTGCIQTVRSVGYRLVPPIDTST